MKWLDTARALFWGYSKGSNSAHIMNDNTTSEADNSAVEIHTTSEATLKQSPPQLARSLLSDGSDLADSDQDNINVENSNGSVIVSDSKSISRSAVSGSSNNEKVTDFNETEDTRDMPMPYSSAGGLCIRTCFRPSISLVLNFTIAIVLTALTIAFASTSFSHELIYTPPFLPYNPQYAILVLQIIATLSLMAIQECFGCCAEIFRWSLACRGTDLLSFLVMSKGTDFAGLLNILTARPWNPFARWRVLAIYKISVLYAAVLFGQFVWLLQINSRIAYRTQKSPYQIGISSSVGFSLSPDGVPVPFTTLDVINFWLSGINIYQSGATPCSPEYTDFECATNVCPYGDGFIAGDNNSTLQVIYEVPTVITEFQSNTTLQISSENLGPWAYCIDHTSPSGSYVRLCMGGEQPSSRDNSSFINAAWDVCWLCSGNLDSTLSFATKMSIKTASVTVISWMVNESLAAITDIIDQTPYIVNITDLFKAFSAPLWINQTEQWTDDGIGLATNVTNTTLAADEFADSLGSTLVDSGNFNEATANLLRILLSFSLANNPHGGEIIMHDLYLASQVNALTLSPVSVVGFAVVASIMLICSLIMWGIYPRTRLPNITSFTEIMFGGKLNASMNTVLYELSNGTDRIIIERMVNVSIKVGESVQDGVRRVVISTVTTDDTDSLRAGVE